MAREIGAILVFDAKSRLQDGSILQGRIWLVPKPVAGSVHSFKYSLFFGRPGERAVLYDNERLKAITAITAAAKSLTGLRQSRS